MKKRYTEEQIIRAIKSYEGGRTIEDICRKLGIAYDTFYNQHNKYAELKVNEAKRLKSLELGNN